MHLVFVCYYSFASNSAAQTLSLANHLVELGIKCTVFVPFDRESAEAHREVRFDCPVFSDLPAWLEANAPDPARTLLIAWTPRENVRNFCQRFLAAVPCRYVVHLEDNERLITEVNLGRPFEELRQLAPESLDALVGPEARLSHPLHFPRFIGAAAGITALIDTLADFAPPDMSRHIFWPGYNPSFFSRSEIDYARRRTHGIDDTEMVLVYTGNVHSANRQEVFSLYLAVGLLNRMGVRSRLVRAGEDYVQVIGDQLAELRKHCVELGKVPHSEVGGLLAMADILVQPGRADSFNDYRFPSKVPEFFALGRPVIIPAANLGRFVRNGIDCLVLQRGDAIEIADLVQALHADPVRRVALSDAAVTFANEHFQWKKIAVGFKDFALRILQGSPRSPLESNLTPP